MATKTVFIFLVLYFHSVHSAGLLERSYEYVVSLGKNLAPNFMTLIDCFAEEEALACAREKAGKLLDSWDKEVDKQRRSWAEAADAEVMSSGRSFEELPSKMGQDIELSLTAVSDLVQNGMARALSRKKHDDDGGGIGSITISAASSDKKKKMKKKKKQKPPKIHLVHPVMMSMDKMEEKGPKNDRKVQSWVIGDRNLRKGRGVLSQMWDIGEKALDAVAEHAIESEDKENGLVDRSSIEEQRGKKKKKKKAILKLLILGAVLKAKIGTLLQILSFKLQVKFFIIALIGLAINLARFWVELKNKHNQQPQKVIYYEHAQHQHHYDHEEEPGWGPWSRSMDPEEAEAAVEEHINSPYRAHDRNAQVYPTRPLLTLS